MKYIKLYEELYDTDESIERLEDLLDHYDITGYELDDGRVDVHNGVSLDEWNLTEFPITFNNVFGNFTCYNNKLTTLKNGPYSAMDYDCSVNNLTSLEFGPGEVMEDFRCEANQLTSLEFSPHEVDGHFSFSSNPVYNFDGLNTFGGEIHFNNTPISMICGVYTFTSGEFKEFRERFEKAVDGKKVKLTQLKFIRHIYSDKVENLEDLVIKNGYEIA